MAKRKVEEEQVEEVSLEPTYNEVIDLLRQQISALTMDLAVANLRIARRDARIAELEAE